MDEGDCVPDFPPAAARKEARGARKSGDRAPLPGARARHPASAAPIAQITTESPTHNQKIKRFFKRDTCAVQGCLRLPGDRRAPRPTQEADADETYLSTTRLTHPMSQGFGLYCAHFTGEETEASGVSEVPKVIQQGSRRRGLGTQPFPCAALPPQGWASWRSFRPHPARDRPRDSPASTYNPLSTGLWV